MRHHFRTSYSQEIRSYEDGRQLMWYLLLLLVAIVAPFLLDEYLLGEATQILIWALAGMGLMVLAGHTGQVSLGHGAFLACGAYMQNFLVSLSIPFLFALPLSGLFAGTVGVCFAVPALRLSGVYLSIATLALGAIAEDIIIMLEPWTGGVEGVYLDSAVFLGIDFDRYADGLSPLASAGHNFYWLCLMVVLLVTIGYINLLRSATGRALTAIRDSEISARAIGIDVAKYKTLSFALSCFVTGIAGALLAHFLGAFNYEAFTILISIQLLMMITIGGIGYIHGAFVGAILIVLLPLWITIIREHVSGFLELGNASIPGLDQAVIAVLIILFILIEPMGVYGRWLKVRGWWRLFPLARKKMFRRHRTYLKTERLR